MSPLKKIYLSFLLILTTTSLLSAAGERMPFPQNKTYGLSRPSGSYQSLANDIITLYELYKSKFLKQFDGDYYIESRATDGNQWTMTVSEAHGFGMTIFAIMAGYDPNAKTYFDGMVDFWGRYRMSNNLMAWQIWDEGEASWGSATDGDLDIAYAFLLAYEQWKDNTYLNNALAILDGLSSYSINSAELPRIDEVGGSIDALSRPSDWMTGHFRVFDDYDNGYNWNNIVSNIYSTYNSFVSSYSSSTGLISDFTENGAPSSYQIETQYDDEYYYNACRVPMRFAMDYARSGNLSAKNILEKIANWIESECRGEVSNIKSGYTLSGSPIDDYNSIEYMAPFGCAMIATDKIDLINDIWNELKKDYMHSEATAYGSAINLLSMLVMSGNWWKPGDDDTYVIDIPDTNGVVLDNFGNAYGDDNAQSFLGALNGVNWGDEKYGYPAGDTTYHYGGCYWYGYTAKDATVKSASGEVIFDDGNNSSAESDKIVTDSILDVTFDIKGSNSSKYDFAAIEIPLIADINGSGVATERNQNLSNLTGITIRYKSTGPLRLSVVTNDASSLEYGNYGFDIPPAPSSFQQITLSIVDIKPDEYSPLADSIKASPSKWGWDISGKKAASAISFTVSEGDDEGANVNFKVQEIILNGMKYNDFGLTYRKPNPPDPVELENLTSKTGNLIKTTQISKGFLVSMNFNHDSNVKLKLFNIAGKEIKSLSKNYGKGLHNIKIEGSSISSGRYILQSIINGKKTISSLNFIR